MNSNKPGSNIFYTPDYMVSENLRIVFMGTPDFAVESLRILVEHGYNIVGVITAPDKPRGRGRKPAPSPVKQYALKAGLHILQPANLKAPEFLQQLADLSANLQIVVAFRMLPRAVWEMPELGTFNLHASLLPDYRGAAPIHWAIINGERKTGVTTFFLQHEIDTGEIILQEEELIGPDDSVGDLYERLMVKGANLVLKTVRLIESGDVSTNPQDPDAAHHPAPKLFRENTEIDFNRLTADIHNFIRGLSPFPAAWFNLDNEIVKILKSHPVPMKAGQPGSFETDQKTFWHIHTGDGGIAVDELQWQGKKRMQIEDFLRGNDIPIKNTDS
ncbi:MAG: methionyl-tRNA formyltransferase [Cyclobacteriaceae bacterium]